MASFFNFGARYSKPGPGVSKSEPQKHRIFLFLELYFRKFWKLIQVNMLYFLFCIPIVTIGPATAAFTYIMRNYAREEHAFIWSDFIEQFKKNFKQSFIVSLIDIPVYGLMIFNFWFYSQHLNDNILFGIAFGLFITIAVLYTFAKFYIYQLIVTFDLKLKDIYKDCFIMAIVGLLRNFLLFVVIALVVFLLYLFPIFVVFVPFLTLSFLGFLINFTTYPLIKKLLIDPQEAPQEVANKDDDIIMRDNRIIPGSVEDILK